MLNTSDVAFAMFENNPKIYYLSAKGEWRIYLCIQFAPSKSSCRIHSSLDSFREQCGVDCLCLIGVIGVHESVGESSEQCIFFVVILNVIGWSAVSPTSWDRIDLKRQHAEEKPCEKHCSSIGNYGSGACFYKLMRYIGDCFVGSLLWMGKLEKKIPEFGFRYFAAGRIAGVRSLR